jgi:hypothetical protein
MHDLALRSGLVYLGLAFSMHGCLSGDDSGGGGNEAGASCTSEDRESDRKVCSGEQVLECKEDPEGDDAYVWKVDDDCAAEGRRCLSGECVEAPAGNPGLSDDCPDLSGTWIFTENCEPENVGRPYNVVPTGCTYTVTEPWNGWSGTISADGSVTSTGPTADGTLVCAGEYDADDDQIKATCEPGGCRSKLERDAPGLEP